MIDSKQCHDCGVFKGQVHYTGCDMEECPFCRGQLISCRCCYIKLNLVDIKKYPLTEGLPLEIFNNGLSDELALEWDEILKEKGFIPYGSEERFNDNTKTKDI